MVLCGISFSCGRWLRCGRFVVFFVVLMLIYLFVLSSWSWCTKSGAALKVYYNIMVVFSIKRIFFQLLKWVLAGRNAIWHLEELCFICLFILYAFVYCERTKLKMWLLLMFFARTYGGLCVIAGFGVEVMTILFSTMYLFIFYLVYYAMFNEIWDLFN